MQKKQLQIKKSPIYLEYQSKVVSFSPVIRNGWAIKFSVLNHTGILLIFTSTYTGQTIIRYFDDEDKAVNFVNYIVNTNPSEKVKNEVNP